MPASLAYCIGIDGGGTKTEGVLTDLAGQVLCTIKQGASNPNDVGLDASADVIVGLIKALLADRALSPSQVSVFAGIAGALLHREALTAEISQRLPTLGAMKVHSDVINLLSAHAPDGNGVCLICGTGSVCFARLGETLIRVGGWGYLLDGAGSGYDIGRMALTATLQAHDGRVDPADYSALTEALTAHLGKPPCDALTEIYAGGKPYIAACAPVVFEVARTGDRVAEHILNDNARYLADCIVAALEKMPHEGKIPVILGGSICVKEAPDWTNRIRCFMGKKAENALLQVSDAPPVLGALAEALGSIEGVNREEAFADYRRTVLETYPSYS